jgi:hypothetical protein
VGRKAYWVSLRQPGRRNIYNDIGGPAFFVGTSGAGRTARQKETAMRHSERKTLGSLLKQLIPVITLAFFMAPSAIHAEPLLLLHNADHNYLVPETAQKAVKRPVDVGLNTNGDLVIRCSNVLFTLAHSPHNEIIEPQERARILQRQEYPSINGMSVKISFLF